MSRLDFQGVHVSTDYASRRELILSSQGWQEILVTDKSEHIDLRVGVNNQEDVFPFTVSGGKAEYLAGECVLSVPVRWDRDIPLTRQKGVDNIDVILLDEDGPYTDVQIGLITRRGRFYVTIQQVYKGWITRTRVNGAGRVAFELIPTDPIHAYPGCDYANIWRPMGEELIRMARELGTSRPLSMVRKLSEVKVVRWNPPLVSVSSGWSRGVVLFFNMITGTGQIEQVGTGELYFVHFNQILGGDQVPVLEPMTGVYFRPQAGEHKVKSVKAAA